MVSRVVGRRRELRLHVDEDDHPIEIEILRRRLLGLLASAVDEAFKRHHLGAVHVDTLADLYEAVLTRRHRKFEVFDDLVDLRAQCLDFVLLTLEALTSTNLLSFVQHYERKGKSQYHWWKAA